jgi:hypothetical protein
MEFEYPLRTRVMNMKRFILLFTSVFMIITGAASSMEGLALGVTKGLMPLLEPIAKKTVVAGIDHVKGIATGKKCLIGCTAVGSLYCKTERGLSLCKAACQEKYQVGGYELRIRYRIDTNEKEKWSLTTCVSHGVQGGEKTRDGKGNTKSIAVYSHKDFKSLLNLISLQMAAREVIDTRGSELKEEDLKEKGISREVAVKDASELVEHISASIKKNVQDGIYGNQ